MLSKKDIVAKMRWWVKGICITRSSTVLLLGDILGIKKKLICFLFFLGL